MQQVSVPKLDNKENMMASKLFSWFFPKNSSTDSSTRTEKSTIHTVETNSIRSSSRSIRSTRTTIQFSTTASASSTLTEIAHRPRGNITGGGRPITNINPRLTLTENDRDPRGNTIGGGRPIININPPSTPTEVDRNPRGNSTGGGRLITDRKVPGARRQSRIDYPYKVIKTNMLYDEPRDRIPVYMTHSKNRGTALILNNVKFHEDHLYRKGAEKDERDLTSVLKQIGFKVESYKNVTGSGLRETLKKFSRQKKFKNEDICMVIIMSHGTNRNIPGGYTEVLCTDGKGITTDDILSYFDETNSTYLKGKPKIFIFQCCRSGTQSDANPFKPQPSAKSNTLIAHSTIPGFTSQRDAEKGTWYIQTLCQVLAEHAHEYHIEEMLKIVETELKKMDTKLKQVSCYENRGFFKCYFHPQ